MEYVEPIKDIEKIHKIKQLLKKQSKRDFLFFVIGINTGMRINELLHIKVADIYEKEKVKEFIYITDKKTNHVKAFYLNNKVKEALSCYIAATPLSADDFLFKSKKNNCPISRQQAYRIINKAAKDVGITCKIGTHTLRKTFGYHAYRKGIAISILQSIFNHTTPSETLRYIGIDKHDEQQIKVDVNL